MKRSDKGAPGLATSRALTITNIRFAAAVPAKSISSDYILRQRRKKRIAAICEFVGAFVFLLAMFFMAGMGGY